MSFYYPLNYDQINIAAGLHSPSAVKSYNNRSFWFWCRSLYQRMASIYEIELPESWRGDVKDFFTWCLFRYGFLIITRNEKFGLFFQPGTLSGFDLYYQPVRAIISNPLYNAELDIGKNCELLKLTPDYLTTFDIVEYYAEKLSQLDNSINMGLVNSKFAFMYAAKNKAAGQALKKMLDQINKGEPAVITDLKVLNDPNDKDLPFQEIRRDHLKDSYLTTDQLMDMQTIINSFDAEIGIPTVPYQKKERLVTDEANMRNLDAKARCVTWYETLQSSLDNVKKLYPDADISIEYRYEQQKVGQPESVIE